MKQINEDKKVKISLLDGLPQGLYEMYAMNFDRVFGGDGDGDWEASKNVIAAIVA